ncbi:MAG TPA: hypothetical protein VHD91_08780 [Gaiellaceae bacterium]|nr:hypothetical protein [Gaiellaceae bacterium]
MTFPWPGRRALYAPALIAYAGLRVAFTGFHASRYTDTPTYEHTAAAPLWSVRFWAGTRGFTLPLVYKVIGNDEARIGFQLAFSIVAWSVLAIVFARSLQTGGGRFAGFAVVLLFSLTRYVIGWDPLLLSESLSISLFALLVATLLVVARRPSGRSVAALLVLFVLWTFARDSNGVVLFVAGLVALVLALRPRRRGLKLALGAAAIAVFACSVVTTEVGKRWQGAFAEVMPARAAEYPQLRRALKGHRTLTARRRAYEVFLVTHPVYLLVDPFVGTEDTAYSSRRRADALLSPHLDSYAATLNGAARPVRAVFDVFWIHPLGAVLALAALALGAAGVASRGRPDEVGWVGLAVLASAYPAALGAWHLAGTEVDRHAIGAGIALRLGSWLLLAYALDRLLASREARR